MMEASNEEAGRAFKLSGLQRSPSDKHTLKVLISDHDYQAPGFEIPPNYNLIVTTAGGVYSLTHKGIFEVFKSAYEEITAAKPMKDNILAVADGHIVFLYDQSKDWIDAHRQSQRLKSHHERPNTMYFDHYSDTLFFTTGLQNAVQSFSLTCGELLEPSPSHPSPVTVFAFSSTFKTLVSASVDPPVTLVTNLLAKEPPMLLQPACSTSSVVAATFHPQSDHLLALAFADSTIALYDIHCLQSARPQKKFRTCPHPSKGEIGHAKNLHVVTTAFSQESDSRSATYDTTTFTCTIGDICSGINAIAFVPGLKCTIVSVATDGHCCVVDFQNQPPQLSTKWHIHDSASSLTVFESHNWQKSSYDVPEEQYLSQRNLLIAIGRNDGKLVVYDLSGNLLARRKIGSGTKILGIDRTAASQVCY